MNGDSPKKGCPAWVERSLQEAPFVVVRRANLFDGMIPVGVRGSSRQQRSAAYLAPKSIRNRITPEQLAANQGWLTNARTEEIPGFKVLAGIEEKLANLPLAYGPTGSIGFELASGLPTATSTSDFDLLIRAPERLPMQLAGLSQLGLIEIHRGASMLDGGPKVSPTNVKIFALFKWAETRPWQ
jgi:phosphoribosyl-dephospho-CoA transferase